MIAVIDYGMGNVRSVVKAFEIAGARVCVTASAMRLRQARALVLPGVGAFGAGMRNLRQRGLPEIITRAVAEKPFLGICLGMQLLFSRSSEHGNHRGLGVIAGDVVRFAQVPKVPHMGWNAVRRQDADCWRVLFDGVPDGAYCYFVHSYYARPRDTAVVAAVADYGNRFCCVAAQDNCFGIQFHPEKSGEVGLRIIKNFCRLCGEG